MARELDCDVLVVGGGNAGLCAAAAAVERGARVVLFEKAPRADRGGNSALTVAMRFVCETLDDLLELAPDDLSEEGRAAIEERFTPLDEAGYWDEMMRATDGQTDPELLQTLVSGSRPTVRWLRGRGQEFVPCIERTTQNAVMMDGRGRGYQERNYAYVEGRGVEVLYETSAVELLQDSRGAVTGAVAVSASNGGVRVNAGATVLAAGGFEGAPAMRASYLGPGWDTVVMRGVPFNTGDGLRMALDAGAATHGNWSNAHASPQGWDRPAGTLPSTESTELGSFSWSRYSYPYGLMVNRDGRRFTDEAPDVRSRSYARMGRLILAQPGGYAFQLFDAQARELGVIADSYSLGESQARADTLEELAERLGIAAEPLAASVAEFNSGAPSGVARPSTTTADGRATSGVWPPKSNYAMRFDTPPYEGYKVRCGITFTFGGLRIDPSTAAVMHTGGWAIPGLYAAGGIIGGLFYGNYSGGSGLTAGAVFGRLAGEHAAAS